MFPFYAIIMFRPFVRAIKTQILEQISKTKSKQSRQRERKQAILFL